MRGGSLPLNGGQWSHVQVRHILDRAASGVAFRRVHTQQPNPATCAYAKGERSEKATRMENKWRVGDLQPVQGADPRGPCPRSGSCFMMRWDSLAKIAAGKEMNRLQSCMEVLRRLAKEPDDPDCVILAEQAIDEYLKNEVDALKAALTRVGEAIDEEAGKRQDEDWSVMIGYVQSCLEKLPGANEDWEQN
jgi:hypothetical protein